MGSVALPRVQISPGPAHSEPQQCARRSDPDPDPQGIRSRSTTAPLGSGHSCSVPNKIFNPARTPQCPAREEWKQVLFLRETPGPGTRYFIAAVYLSRRKSSESLSNTFKVP